MTQINSSTITALQLPPQLKKPLKPLQAFHFIKGQKISGHGAKKEVISPYFGQSLGHFHEIMKDELELAIESAHQAALLWRTIPLKERCKIMFNAREILLARKSEISQVISLESGKTLLEAEAGLMKGLEVLEFALSLQNLDIGGRMEVSRGVSCEYERAPLGVVAGITPFNFPAMVPMWMIPIAITTGNSFLWKPSEKTPLTSVYLAEVFQAAGLPDGVLTVVQGGKETVEAICRHPLVKAVGFVGSTAVAKRVYQLSTSEGKRALCLGGAKNHVILMPDADSELASAGILDSFTGCAGQRCMAASVLLAVGNVDAIIEKIKSKMISKKLGWDMGAIISKESLHFLHQSIEKAVAEGASLMVDGRTEIRDGFWLAPTILDHVQPGSHAAKTELFGPVLSIIRCQNLSQALQIASESPYGNALSVFTGSGAIAERVIREASCGMVGINIGVPVPREPFSFGGTKESKFGHGDITGSSSLDFWTDLKKITKKWATQHDQTWMS